MALDSPQKRMSAVNPGCPWRGPLVYAEGTGFDAGNRAGALGVYWGLLEGEGGGDTVDYGYFPHTYFAMRYFPDRYFPGGDSVGVVTWFVEAADVWVPGAGLNADVWVPGADSDADVWIAGAVAGEVIPR